MNLSKFTLKNAIKSLAQKKFSAEELVSACLGAIHSRDKELRAFLEVFEDEVLERARLADANRGNSLQYLFGIPAALKDNILTNGHFATAASKILENYVASYDATVVKRLKNAGAIFLGRTNMDEFAMGSSTENSSFGPTRNPHDLSRVPGGSSGGSAAAVAADECIFALGSDTGGSIRQPAAFCGVVGLKPTYGRVSRHGLIALASSLDQIGPITKTVEDAAIVLKFIEGRDRYDSTTVDLDRVVALDDLDLKIPNNLNGLRVGMPKEYFTKGLDERIEKMVKDSIRVLEKNGARIQEVSLPHSEYALATYYIILPAEVSANLARFDGIRYGNSIIHHSSFIIQNLYEVYAKTRAEGFGAEVKRRIMLGAYALSAGYYDAYYLKAQKVRKLIREDFEKAFQEVDVIVGPTTPNPAFKFGEKSNPVSMYLEDIYTVAVNLAGLPAISLPCGFVEEDKKKLPVGFQMIGKWFDEKRLLSWAGFLEKILNLKTLNTKS